METVKFNGVNIYMSLEQCKRAYRRHYGEHAKAKVKKDDISRWIGILAESIFEDYMYELTDTEKEQLK